MPEALNDGGGYARRMVAINEDEQLAIYDSMPAEVRAVVRNAFIQFNLTGIHEEITEALGFLTPKKIAGVLAAKLRDEAKADAEACYGPTHPIAKNPPVEYLHPLSPKRTRPFRGDTRIR